MATPRFYCPEDLETGAHVELRGQAGHHALRVLRLAIGDGVILFNGLGGEYEGRIVRADKRGVAVHVGPWRGGEREPPLSITLAQAISSGEKMDFTIQKAVELGVACIQPLAGSRSVVRLDQARADKRVRHWQGVAISACEQCGRNRVPEVAPVMALADWLRGRHDGALRIMLSPHAGRPLRDIPAPSGRVTLLVGPEGGFSADEEQAALAGGFQPICLGPRILRTETAALAAVAAMQTLWGDF